MKVRSAAWKFDEEITKKIRVRGWFSDYYIDEPEYKYNSVQHLVATVDEFISKNNIKNIIRYENTARTVEVDEGWDMVYDKRIGGITLVYSIDEELPKPQKVQKYKHDNKKPKNNTGDEKAKNQFEYHQVYYT